MFRILGFLVGSAASVGAIIMLVGMPEFHLTTDVVDDGRYDEAIRKLKEKYQPAEPREDEAPMTAPADRDANAAQSPPIADIEPNGDADEGRVAGHDGSYDAVDDLVDTSDAGPNAGRDGELAWHAFWNPFRSEIAATGFVRRLEAVTGIDYRVVRVKKGVYQAAFSYSSDAERDTKLSEIAGATGLVLTDNNQ